MDHLTPVLHHLPSLLSPWFLFLSTAFFLVWLRCRKYLSCDALSKFLGSVVTLTWQRAFAEKDTWRGRSIQVADRATAHRTLVQHSTVFLDRPTGAVPSSILTQNIHFNIISAPYGPYWRAVRRNLAGGVIHPSHIRQHHDASARVLRELVRALKSGAPAGESLHFSVYCIMAEMCFGREIVSELGETGLRAMQKFQRDTLLALRSFGVLVKYPRIGKLFCPSRWHRLVALRRQQEDLYLPLVAEIKNRRAGRNGSTITTYVDTLLDLRIHEDGDRVVTNGELVSLISEFLGAGTDSTAAALEWTMANLVKHPRLQQKLRTEVDAIACDGGEGAVDEADLSRMPYLKAVVLESLRRHPPVPFVLRHADGGEAAEALGVSRMPAGGATVKFHVGDICRDPVAWSEPMSFTPERFMPGGDGTCADLTCTRELKMIPFGAGRRACPGIALATHHLEFLVANLVREFEWCDVEGEEVDLTEFHGFFFFVVMKRPLRARLVPRSAK